jgi:hypothetical protein
MVKKARSWSDRGSLAEPVDISLKAAPNPDVTKIPPIVLSL